MLHGFSGKRVASPAKLTPSRCVFSSSLLLVLLLLLPLLLSSFLTSPLTPSLCRAYSSSAKDIKPGQEASMDLQASFVAECGIASAWPASSSLNSLVKQVECDLTFHPPPLFPLLLSSPVLFFLHWFGFGCRARFGGYRRICARQRSSVTPWRSSTRRWRPALSA